MRTITICREENQGNNVLAIDFDMIFSVWKGMKEGREKEKLEKTLKTSPLFETMLKQGIETKGVVTPQEASEKQRKGKAIAENTPLEISGSVRNEKYTTIAIKFPIVGQNHFSANTPVNRPEEPPIHETPLQNNNPDTSSISKPKQKSSKPNISPPNFHLHSPSPLTDHAIGLIKSLPKPNNPNTPNPTITNPISISPDPLSPVDPILTSQNSTTRDLSTGNPNIPGHDAAEPNEGLGSMGLRLEFNQTPEQAESQEFAGEPEPEEEPVEYEDMQEEDYHIYEDYEANHQADLSAIEQQSTIDDGEPEILGEYVTPTASKFDLQMFKAAYGAAAAEPPDLDAGAAAE